MATIRIPNIDEAGNFTNPDVLARLRENIGGNLAAELPTPFYIAHRGGPLAAPENTLEAFRVNDATGIEVLEADIQPAGDGALVLLHDSTVDRTTDGTGPVNGYTVQTLKTLNASEGSPWPDVCRVPTLREFLTEFGGHRVIMIESKNLGELDKMLDTVEDLGIQGNVIVETSTLSIAEAAVARSYKVWFFWGFTPTNPSLQTVVDAGVQHLAVASAPWGGGVSDATVAEMVATGLPVTVYTVNRRFDRDRFLAQGVVGISGDNPSYVKTNTATTTRDSWRYGMWGNGLSSNRATLPPIDDGAIALQTTGTNVYEVITPGEVLPIAKTTYTIDVDLGWRTLPTDLTKALQVQFCIRDDQAYNYATKTQPWGYSDCYQLHLRANGQLAMYRLNQFKDGVEAASVQIGSTVTTPAMAAGEFAHARITVTPTNITIQRTDVESAAITSAQTALRGGYINLTRFSDNGVALFRDLVIS